MVRPIANALVVGLLACFVATGFFGGSRTMIWGQDIVAPTFGGAQFWTDCFIHGNWRIQQNAVSGHYRLLDDRNFRRAAGTYAHCRERFDKFRKDLDLPPLKKTTVVLLHGLGRTRNALSGLAKTLVEDGEWSAINVSYASTRKSVSEHAAALKQIVENLEGVEEVHFVGHSLGNIVIRHYLADRSREAEQGTDNSLPAIGRIVMLAPPNNGSAVARILKDLTLFRWILGTTGQELGGAWDRLQPRLATPHEFGIIAGSLRDGEGANPMIPGDDDLVVGVDETKLPGAKDFLEVPAAHTFIMNHEGAQRATLSFLRRGYFRSEKERNPLPLPKDP
jgi:pimeloyl-ACP methyl ester carboxylesterase